MELGSVRELKASLTRSVTAPLGEGIVRTRALHFAAQSLGGLEGTHRGIALGVARKGNQYRLAVRVQRPELMRGPQMDQISKAAKGEVDVVYMGRLTKRARPWYQQRQRPLRIGCSVAHYQVTAGSIGGFVKDGEQDGTMILSNNHVLANENRAKPGDPIVQPGPYDGGQVPADRVALLARFVPLEVGAPNKVDCAVASLVAGITVDAFMLQGIGVLTGVRDTDLAPGDAVQKVGRTTGVTAGRVTATEMDNVIVGYDVGNLRFDNQIEIEGAGNDSFSEGGDSGSLIVDDARKAAALLFAGGDQGGTNGRGYTFANPIGAVLGALKVRLLYSDHG